MIDSIHIILITFLFGLFGFMVFIIRNFVGKPDQSTSGPDEDNEVKPTELLQPKTKKKSHVNEKRTTNVKDKFNHPWLFTTLKGHSGRVTDFDLSENGKYLASAADDRIVLVWFLKDFAQAAHKTHRVNISYDSALKVKWSPDSKALVVHKDSENCAEVYKISKKDDGGFGQASVCLTFPKVHETDVIGMGFAPTGKFIMTCSDKTQLVIWSIRGEQLAILDTYHMNTYCAKVSPCGRFVATSGFTPDVKVWEVKFNRNGDFDKAHRAFELSGHSSGIFHFDFNADSSRMATLSKDGTWKVFNTKIEFDRGQDPTCLITGNFSDADMDDVIALSADGSVVAIAHRTAITFFSVSTGKELSVLKEVHSQPITCLQFDKEGRWLISSGDKHLRVFHNVPGFREKVMDLMTKLKSANTESLKERLKNQIEEVRRHLKSLGD